MELLLSTFECSLEQVRLKFLKLSEEFDYPSIDWNEYYSDPDQVLPDPLPEQYCENTEGNKSLNEVYQGIDCNNYKEIYNVEDPVVDTDVRMEEATVSKENTAIDRYEGEEEYVFGQDDDNEINDNQIRKPLIEIVSDDEEIEYEQSDEDSECEIISDLEIVAEPKKKTVISKFQEDDRQFARMRDDLLLKYYEEFNKVIFKNKLPKMRLLLEKKKEGIAFNSIAMENKSIPEPYLKWNNTLRKTAGVTKMYKKGNLRSVAIELSTKVCDCIERLRKTLAHEMCHVATFWLHNMKGHGKTFFYYGSLVTKAYSDIPVTTCHTYDIKYKYQYKCKSCNTIIRRHSKSLKIEQYVCRFCGKLGTYEMQKKTGNGTNEVALRTPSKYNLFVKENFARIKIANAHVSHKDIMKLIAEEYKKAEKGI
jgi:predicted SprT family Zn-dependent metalloprotease